MKKLFLVVLTTLLQQSNLLSCRLTIKNDDAHDLFVVDQTKATLIRSNKKGVIGLEEPTNFAIYKATKTSKDCNDFVIAYLVTEKRCPSEIEIKENKKINTFDLSFYEKRSKTNLDTQKNDFERFIVEDVGIKKKSPK